MELNLRTCDDRDLLAYLTSNNNGGFLCRKAKDMSGRTIPEMTLFLANDKVVCQQSPS